LTIHRPGIGGVPGAVAVSVDDFTAFSEDPGIFRIKGIRTFSQTIIRLIP
jgi:hypothetical protein